MDQRFRLPGMLLPAFSIDAYLTRYIHVSIMTVKDLDSSIAHLASGSQRQGKSRKSHWPAVINASRSVEALTGLVVSEQRHRGMPHPTLRLPLLNF